LKPAIQRICRPGNSSYTVMYDTLRAPGPGKLVGLGEMIVLFFCCIGVLLGLAITIGHALDRQARSAAWERIATSRRTNQEKARELEEYQLVLQVREDELERREQRVNVRERAIEEREHLVEKRERTLPGG
jgi:hypothetical protein